MADFQNSKLRKLFEPGGLLKTAGVEDLALVIALCRNETRAVILRAEHLAQADDIDLDPLPAKVTPQDGEAKG